MKKIFKKALAVLLSVVLIATAVYLPSGTLTNVSAEEIFIIPDSADNSTSPYFPEVGNQGSMGSCTSWAHVYYSFTYAMNKLRGIKTTPENTYSPQWSFNLTSNGEGDGSTAADIEWFLEKQGAVTLSMVPYVADPITWCSDEKVWRESINNRLLDTIKYSSIGSDKTQITSPDDNDLDEVKTALAKGNVLTFSTTIYSWVTTKLKSHKDAPENEKFMNQEAVKFVDGAEGSHAMAVVGYNDDIWVDVNDNGKVDSGEMGAFKIVNSWGDKYANDGFIWMAYDAVNKHSSVNGFNGPEHRVPGMTGIEGVIARPYGEGTDIYIRYNFSTGNRRESNIVIKAEKDGTVESYKAFFPLLTLTSGDAKIPYDGNMLIALDNVVEDISAENFFDYNWSVEFTDKYEDECETTYRNAEIVIESKNLVIKPQGSYPFTLNGNSKSLEFSKSVLNHAVVYYRGYANPKLSYKLPNGDWSDAELMESNSEREGYVNKYVIDLKDKDYAEIYFEGQDGNKDTNNGKYFKVEKGLNYFVTKGVAEPMKAELEFDADKMEKGMLHEYTAKVSGGYAPYSYTFIFTNLETGEVKETYEKLNENTVNYIINIPGKYSVEAIITDYEGTKVTTSGEFEVVDSSFEFSDFEIVTEDELFTGKPVDFFAKTRYESIIRYGESCEKYNIMIEKDGDLIYEDLIKPIKVDHNKMTSDIEYSWTPTEPGHYIITISGEDFGKEYAEKVIEFDVVNKVYIYYRGFYSPDLNFLNTDGTWSKKPMEVCTDSEGYTNMLCLELGKSEDILIYFSDAKGAKDDNDGEYYKVKAGRAYFITNGVSDPLKAEIKANSNVFDVNAEVKFTAEVSGGYSPYTYTYLTENLQSGEKTYSEATDIAEYSAAFDAEGKYRITLYVTDYAGEHGEASLEFTVITPTEAVLPTTLPEATETTTEVFVTSTPDETETTTDKPEIPTEIIEEVVGIVGDTNADTKVSIKDVTIIQKYLASMDIGTELSEEVADCNKDGKVNIKDATAIQKYLALYEISFIGEEIIRYVTVTLPMPEITETSTKASEAETTTVTETSVLTEPSETTALITEVPTEKPTENPVETDVTLTEVPTEETTALPTEAPTEKPTEAPTEIPTEDPTEAPTEEPTEPPTEPEVRTVTFTNSFFWSGEIKCYYWSDADTTMVTWPGSAMNNAGVNDFGETMYTFDVPKGVTYIIFTNGTNQTVDIPYVGEARYYPTNTKNDKGHFMVELW